MLFPPQELTGNFVMLFYQSNIEYVMVYKKEDICEIDVLNF